MDAVLEGVMVLSAGTMTVGIKDVERRCCAFLQILGLEYRPDVRNVRDG